MRKQDKNQTILKALLKGPGNNSCADCKTAAHPRWASWNLGIFICIRCSGIHRSMGTHISRVKSVDLDTWTDEQVASMVKWGNIRANQYWEGKLPENYKPDESKIENFIRTKYDLKKWVASPTIPNPSSIAPPPQASSAQTTTAKSSDKGNLLDLEFGSPIAAKTQSPPQQSQQQFSSISHNPSQQQQQRSQHIQQQQSQPQQFQQPQQQQQQPQQVQRDNTRPELKKSILSLYSTPLAASNSTPSFSQNQPQTHNHLQGLNSLNGLNFNSVPSLQHTQQPISSTQSTSSLPQWTSSNDSVPSINSNINNNNNNNWNNSNPWSTVESRTTTNTGSTTSNLGLDDPFKNVWN